MTNDVINFNLYSCLVVAIENAEGRVEGGLTEAWIENAKRAVSAHEIREGCADLIYPR